MLYHASGEVVEFPEVRKSKYTKDLSWGFYCTNYFEQAKKWAKRNRKHATVNYYTYAENKNLNILRIKLVFTH